MKYILLHGLGQVSSSWDDTVKMINDELDILCPNLSDWICEKNLIILAYIKH